MIDRIIYQRLRATHKSVLLLGPRQVGKSTLCRSLNPLRVVNLADESLFLSYSKDPGRLLRELKKESQKSGLIVIDEIQRVPALLNSVQAYLDENGKHRFLLTGSSARKLKRGGTNLLPGRILIEYLDPLTIWELKDDFNLDRALSVGLLPGVYGDPLEGTAVLNTYGEVYLREEIRAEALTKNLGAYARFLDVAAEASGSWINYSKIASDTEIPKETIRRFYDILTETLVAVRLPAFEAVRTHRRISQRDRYFLFDVGVRNALLGLAGQKLPAAELGKIFEQWFILQCLTFIKANKKNWKPSSFRTDSGLEVDLVIDTGSKLVAVECKHSRNVGVSDLKGLQSLELIAHKPVKKFVVCLAEQAQKFPTGEIVLNVANFLLEELPAI